MTKINITIWTYVELAVSLWAACVLYIIPLKHRPNFRMRLGPGDGGDLRCGCGGSLVEDGISGSDRSGGGIHVGRFSAELPVYLLSRGHAPGAAVYCAAWAIISQQIAHESAFIVLRSMGIGGQLSAIGYMVVIYAVIYGMAGITIVRYMPENGVYQVGPRQLSSALFLLIVLKSCLAF